MGHWTPDQISSLIENLVKLVGGVLALLYALKKTGNSIPNDLAHKLIDNVQNSSGVSLPESTGATINVARPTTENTTPTTVVSLEGSNTNG